MTQPPPNFAAALVLLPAEVAVAVREASAAFVRTGVAHALCGDLALSCYAEPRSTMRVHFLVDEGAFEHHGLLVCLKPGLPVRVGAVPVEITPLFPLFKGLGAALAESRRAHEVPVLSAEALVAMKLVAGRLRDSADVQALLASGAVDVDACRALVASRFGAQLASFEQLLVKAGE